MQVSEYVCVCGGGGGGGWFDPLISSTKRTRLVQCQDRAFFPEKKRGPARSGRRGAGASGCTDLIFWNVVQHDCARLQCKFEGDRTRSARSGAVQSRREDTFRRMFLTPGAGLAALWGTGLGRATRYRSEIFCAPAPGGGREL